MNTQKKNPQRGRCMNLAIKRLGASVALLTLGMAFTVHAMTTQTGAPVKKIPFANQIHDWQALGKRQLLVSTSPSKNYLVTLSRDCHSLNFAQQVGFSASNNTVYAGFDYVTARGQRCRIQSISKVTRAERDSLQALQ